jgi:hypothetical protein
MDGVSRTSRSGMSVIAYDALPQQDGNMPSALHPYHQNKGIMSTGNEKLFHTSSSLPDSIPNVDISRGSTYRLPPKSYEKPSRRKRILIHVAYAVTFIVSLGLLWGGFFLAIISFSSLEGLFLDTTFCTSLDEQAVVDTSISSLLNIDTAYGNLSFGLAKLIDLAWDVLVSRGGQILLGWVAYKVHTAVLLRIMEEKLIPYDLYATMALQLTTVRSLRPLVKTFFIMFGFRKKLLLLWLSLSIIWIAIWPTITNAMTGYIALENTLVKLKDDLGYANFTEIVVNNNLAFRYNATDWMGPILTSSGPDVELWSELQQGMRTI